jgi:anaerobic selenocysteine-containing dehydrogenase
MKRKIRMPRAGTAVTLRCTKEAGYRRFVQEDAGGGGYICAYGRSGFCCIEAETRLTSPMKRIEGELKETTWEDALALVADKLKKARKDAGFISVAGIENEDALLLRKLAESVVKTQNYDTTMSLYADSESLRRSQKADLIRLISLCLSTLILHNGRESFPRLMP